MFTWGCSRQTLWSRGKHGVTTWLIFIPLISDSTSREQWYIHFCFHECRVVVSDFVVKPGLKPWTRDRFSLFKFWFVRNHKSPISPRLLMCRICPLVTSISFTPTRPRFYRVFPLYCFGLLVFGFLDVCFLFFIFCPGMVTYFSPLLLSVYIQTMSMLWYPCISPSYPVTISQSVSTTGIRRTCSSCRDSTTSLFSRWY